MNWIHLGRQVRAIRLRVGLTQAAVAASAHVSRGVVSRLERGFARQMTVASIESVLSAIGARFDLRLLWSGTDLGRMLDAGHAALGMVVKQRLERWGWIVRVEVSYSRYGERGRIDLLAWHPATGILLVVELKTDLVDVQALLGSLDVKARLARSVVAQFGWQVSAVVPAIVFTEDRTTRRRLAPLMSLFDRYDLVGSAAISWLRRPVGVPRGLLWFATLSNARPTRISGQRVRHRRSKGAV
ncbi:MAG: helix-turn-helix domain-containing protein [Chloroflexota bacterium]